MMSTTEIVRTLFVASLLIIFKAESSLHKKVCVIGAGRAGLGALKIVTDQTERFEPIAFERNSDVGGLWIYRDDANLDEHGLVAHSGIYKNLRTVTYKEVMTYPDYPTIVSEDTFIRHDTFLEYMRNYTDHFKLRKYIQFDTLVTKVTPIDDKHNRETTRWRLKKQNLNTNNADEIICDAVIICNGRYSKPKIPRIPGIEQFSGQVLHSRSYRRPEDYTNKTVVVLGAGLSGLGISRDIGNHAKTVYLSHKCDYISDDDGFAENTYIVKAVTEADRNQLILQDKSRIPDADVLIFCTGYLYSFPFLDKSSGIELDGRSIRPLQRNFINLKRPSMAFIGLGHTNTYGVHFYSQTEEFLESL